MLKKATKQMHHSMTSADLTELRVSLFKDTLTDMHKELVDRELLVKGTKVGEVFRFLVERVEKGNLTEGAIAREFLKHRRYRRVRQVRERVEWWLMLLLLVSTFWGGVTFFDTPIPGWVVGVSSSGLAFIEYCLAHWSTSLDHKERASNDDAGVIRELATAAFDRYLRGLHRHSTKGEALSDTSLATLRTRFGSGHKSVTRPSDREVDLLRVQKAKRVRSSRRPGKGRAASPNVGKPPIHGP